jgi:hypothetical protein
MQFDKSYYDKIHLFLQGSDNIIYNVCDLADNQEKFIDYIRLYQHVRKIDEADVQISSDAKQIYVVEFFQNKLNAQVTELLKSQMFIGELQHIAATPLTTSIEPVITNSQPVHITVPVGFNAPVQTQVKKSPFPQK